MKNNKGFTLVEMLVAVAVLILVMAEVGALMVNSQSLYNNGYYEVNLQESAQQVTQQLQDLLMNANKKDGVTHETKYSGSVSSDVITIKTEERQIDGTGNFNGVYEDVVYQIGRRADLFGTDMNNGKFGPYDDLVLTRNGAGPILIAEDVQSIYITKNKNRDSGGGVVHPDDMYNLKTADVITLELQMANKEYRYAATSEVFLRNRPGTGGPEMHPSGDSTGADVDITLLRVHHYDLKKFVPKGYDRFVWDSSAVGADSKYNLDTNGEIECNSVMNNNWNIEGGPFIILASVESSGTTPIKISVHTPKVNDGSRVCVYTWTGTTGTMLNAIPVSGICTCPSCCTMAVADAQITLNLKKNHKAPYNNIDAKYTDNFDLALYGGGKEGFDIKLKKDETHGDGTVSPKGTSVPDDESEVVWENEIFSRVWTNSVSLNDDGPKLKLHNAWFYSGYWKHKGAPYSTEWHDNVPGSTETNLSHNYMKQINNGNDSNKVFWPCGSSGANWCADFQLKSIHVDNKANGFGLNTMQHADNAEPYWKYIVDQDGYVRIHVWCKFANGKVLQDYDHVYDCYGYFFPQKSGTVAQHDKLMDIVTGPIEDEDANPHKHAGSEYASPDDVYEYYGFD
ncbi:MAG: prepilin-type N-terminal cleavage/methylation domain-containing protein [Lachnospiraceae bacterium]|nr:prepilin-type N-terminal cleavage/methylation domain-containing protein [Lachnospiraceae bacterium]